MNDNTTSNLNPSDIGQYIRVSSVSAKVLLFALLVLASGFILWCFCGSVTDREHISGVVFPPAAQTSGASVPNEGTVMEILVYKGEQVREGQTLALISIDGAYSILSAPYNGTVLSYVPENSRFSAFQDVVTVLPEKKTGTFTNIIAYADYNSSREIRPGQEIQATPKNETREKVGFVKGKVIGISSYPVSRNEAVLKLKNASIVDEVFPDGSSVFVLLIELDTEKDNPQNLDWSFPHKIPVDMSVGTCCNIEVITRSRSIFEYLLENAQEIRNSFRLWVK